MVEVPKMMTLPEVAKYLKVSESTIYRMVEHNEIPGFKIGSRIWRFDREVIDRWRMARQQGGQGQ